MIGQRRGRVGVLSGKGGIRAGAGPHGRPFGGGEVPRLIGGPGRGSRGHGLEEGEGSGDGRRGVGIGIRRSRGRGRRKGSPRGRCKAIPGRNGEGRQGESSWSSGRGRGNRRGSPGEGGCCRHGKGRRRSGKGWRNCSGRAPRRSLGGWRRGGTTGQVEGLLEGLSQFGEEPGVHGRQGTAAGWRVALGGRDEVRQFRSGGKRGGGPGRRGGGVGPCRRSGRDWMQRRISRERFHLDRGDG